MAKGNNKRLTFADYGITALEGIGIGSLIAIGIYAVAFIFEVLACTCHLLTCQDTDTVLSIWSWATFWAVVGVGASGGLTIATIICWAGTVAENREKEAEEARKNSAEWRERRKKQAKKIEELSAKAARDIQDEAKIISNIVNPDYKAKGMMENIMLGFSDIILTEAQLTMYCDELNNQKGEKKI